MDLWISWNYAWNLILEVLLKMRSVVRYNSNFDIHSQMLGFGNQFGNWALSWQASRNMLKQETICSEWLNSYMCKTAASIYASEHPARSGNDDGQSPIYHPPSAQPPWRHHSESRAKAAGPLIRNSYSVQNMIRIPLKRHQMYIRKSQKRTAWNPTNFLFRAIGKWEASRQP